MKEDHYLSRDFSNPSINNDSYSSNRHLHLPLSSLTKNRSAFNFKQINNKRKFKSISNSKMRPLIMQLHSRNQQLNPKDLFNYNKTPHIGHISLPLVIKSTSEQPSIISNNPIPKGLVLPNKKKKVDYHKVFGVFNQLIEPRNKVIGLQELLDAVGPKMEKWDLAKHRTIDQCVRIGDKNPEFDVVLHEENFKVDIEKNVCVVKTSLTKQLKHDFSSDDLVKSPYRDNYISDGFRPDFSSLIQNEKEKERLHYFKSAQYLESQYEKQRQNHRSVLIPKVIPKEYIKEKNHNALVILQEAKKIKLLNRIEDTKQKIIGYKNKIGAVLHNGLADVYNNFNENNQTQAHAAS